MYENKVIGLRENEIKIQQETRHRLRKRFPPSISSETLFYVCWALFLFRFQSRAITIPICFVIPLSIFLFLFLSHNIMYSSNLYLSFYKLVYTQQQIPPIAIWITAMTTNNDMYSYNNAHSRLLHHFLI